MAQPAGNVEDEPGEDQHSNTQPDPPGCRKTKVIGTGADVWEKADSDLTLHDAAQQVLTCSAPHAAALLVNALT